MNATAACNDYERLKAICKAARKTRPSQYYHPLSWAVNNGNLDDVRGIIEHGKACAIACSDNDADVAFYAPRLLEESDFETSEFMAQVCSSPLSQAARLGKFDVVKYLASIGVDIEGNYKKKEYCYSALHHAIYHDRPEIATFLLDSGADIELRAGQTGYTPLIHAVKERNDFMTRLLLSRGADVYARDGYGETALFYAVHLENPRFNRLFKRPQYMVEIVRLLLEAGGTKHIDRRCETLLRKNYTDVYMLFFGRSKLGRKAKI